MLGATDPVAALTPRVDIALTTYDGAEFLAEQLESVLAQTYPDWHLYVRDDGSADATVAILEEYRARHPERISVVRDDVGTLGFVQNFAAVLERCDAAYTALCDQDDVWLPDKLRLGLDAMTRLEAEVGPDCPVLVFSDLTVVDARLEVLAESMWAHAGIDPVDASDFGRMLSRNVVTGTTMIVNRALRDCALPIPSCVRFHDYWIAAVAAAAGATSFVGRPTVLYRQHRANATGARNRATLSDSIAAYVQDRRRRASAMAQRSAQARALCERVGATMDSKRRRQLETFLALPDMPLLRRAVAARRERLLPDSVARSIAFVISPPRERP